MLLDGENISRQWVNLQLREQQIELCHIFEVNTMDLLIEFSQIGLGIACVIREFVQHQLEHGTLQEIPLGLTFPPREIGFVCRKKKRTVLFFMIFSAGQLYSTLSGFLLKLIVNQFIFTVPAVQFTDFLTNDFRRMLGSKLSHGFEMNLAAC